MIFNGRPIIRGIRFSVSDVSGYLAAGMTTEELLTEFPFLEPDDIRVALSYGTQKTDHPVIKIELNEANK